VCLRKYCAFFFNDNFVCQNLRVATLSRQNVCVYVQKIINATSWESSFCRGSDRSEKMAQTSSKLKVVRSHSYVLFVSLPRLHRFYSPPDTLPSLDLQYERYLIPNNELSTMLYTYRGNQKKKLDKLCYLVGKLINIKVLMLQEYIRNFDGLKVHWQNLQNDIFSRFVSRKNLNLSEKNHKWKPTKCMTHMKSCKF